MWKLMTGVDDDDNYDISLWELKETATSLKCDAVWVSTKVFGYAIRSLNVS